MILAASKAASVFTFSVITFLIVIAGTMSRMIWPILDPIQHDEIIEKRQNYEERNLSRDDHTAK